MTRYRFYLFVAFYQCAHFVDAAEERPPAPPGDLIRPVVGPRDWPSQKLDLPDLPASGERIVEDVRQFILRHFQTAPFYSRTGIEGDTLDRLMAEMLTLPLPCAPSGVCEWEGVQRYANESPQYSDCSGNGWLGLVPPKFCPECGKPVKIKGVVAVPTPSRSVVDR